MTRPTLVVFGGLPGAGKTTVARAVADALGATFVRVDSLEVAITRAGVDAAGTPAGYTVAQALAGDQLRAGRAVVVDAVNPVHEARAGWVSTAREFDADLHFVRVVLRDEGEHRRRVEGRQADITGHVLPTWQEITDAAHDPWTEPHLDLDNSSSLEHSVATVLDRVLPRTAADRVARGMARLTTADAGDVLTLQLAAWVREAHNNVTLEIPPLHETLDDVRAGLADPRLRAWGLRERGRLVAMVRLSMLDDTTAFVGRLGVAPDLVGTGLGAATLRFVHTQMPEQATAVELVTGLHSLSNQSFYEHLGYEIVERDPEVGIVRMRRPL